jgi:hypothetical protein
MPSNEYESHVEKLISYEELGPVVLGAHVKPTEKNAGRDCPSGNKSQSINYLIRKGKKDLRIEKHTGQQVCILIRLQVADNW